VSFVAFGAVVVLVAKAGISPIGVLRAKDRPPPRNAIERAAVRGGAPLAVGVMSAIVVGSSVSGVTLGNRSGVGLWTAAWMAIAVILFRPRRTRALGERVEQELLAIIAIAGFLDGLGQFHKRRIFPGSTPVWPIAFGCCLAAAVVYDWRRPKATDVGHHE